MPMLCADILADRCYNSMFDGCISLMQGVDLIATHFADKCYYNMFGRCLALAEIHYPSSLSGNNILAHMDGALTFGADNATIHYDL